MRLGVDFGLTVSCYNADANGAACGHCDACRLRAQGFAAEAGVPDPTLSEVMAILSRVRTVGSHSLSRRYRRLEFGSAGRWPQPHQATTPMPR